MNICSFHEKCPFLLNDSCKYLHSEYEVFLAENFVQNNQYFDFKLLLHFQKNCNNCDFCVKWNEGNCQFHHFPDEIKKMEEEYYHYHYKRCDYGLFCKNLFSNDGCAYEHSLEEEEWALLERFVKGTNKVCNNNKCYLDCPNLHFKPMVHLSPAQYWATLDNKIHPLKRCDLQFVRKPKPIEKDLPDKNKQNQKSMIDCSKLFLQMNLTVELFRAIRSTEVKTEKHRLQEWMKDPKDPQRFLDIIPVYLTVLKRKENWNQYLQVLETKAVEKFGIKNLFNKKFLFYLLFINSDEELRVKILKYHSSYDLRSCSLLLPIMARRRRGDQL